MAQATNKWNSSFAFIMAMIGSAVGLGNIWRFSYVVYSNGGGSFFIPYFTAIIIMAIPLLILEYAIGYHFKDSISNILKKIKPKFEYIGWFILVCVFLILTYYMVIIAWDFIYLLLSFFKGWGVAPATYFANNIIVGGDNLKGILEFVLPVSIITIIFWVIVWFISHKDLNDGIGRVVKVLVPMLFLIMAIIVVYALTLPGQMIGLSELFTPNWSSLTNIDIWLAAFGQVLFSLSIGLGITIAYASYLPSNEKLIDKALIVVCSNSGFEIFTAVGVFSILGFMSLNSGIAVSDIATSGSGLLFIVFPEIFNIMGDVAYILGPLFFLCVLFAGLTSALSLMEPLLCSLSYKFGFTRKKSVTIICIIGVLISLIFTTGSGNYILTTTDTFVNEFGILLGVIIQTIIMAWCYGLDRFIPSLSNSSINMGRKWKFFVKNILPFVLLIMWISGVIGIFVSNTPETQFIELILTIIFILVPIILTKLPASDEPKILD
ncbi:sodium-dependent transporter [Methanosphaera cuniculi]|uniref:Sodium:calcium symporter n=1 Tax=Methanosphaera cuniculi TaxID=1077256 RepID=A0A2A2HBP8_9EURY|nr:sodium-dependent transporter [Methanosphaera cuniculi]PAV06684.1 sodium:calcium symporter [Methanosphaera cuniculi]PWL08795.1 sodium:neurotransmitter symporter family protein [Methanosphaera cuniculi]